MRTLCIAALLLASCAPVRGDDDDSGACTQGTLRVCMDWGNGQPVEAPQLWLRAGPQDEVPLEALGGSDGCVEVRADPGDYEWRAGDESVMCLTAYESVTLEACEAVEESFDLSMWCMDGR